VWSPYSLLEDFSKTDKELIRTRIEIGVLGPSALAEEIQKGFHAIIKSTDPLGWSNQMPDEPVLNLYQERDHPLTSYRLNSWGVFLDAIYGGTLGTTFINGLGGVRAKLGWNVPQDFLGGIDPKIGFTDFYIYLIAETDGMLVLHNATISDSFFRNRKPEHEQDLEPAVGSHKYGAIMGYKRFSISYLIEERSNEFKGQEKTMDFGMIKLEYNQPF
jgi:lipid A 3-O-deacylase